MKLHTTVLLSLLMGSLSTIAQDDAPGEGLPPPVLPTEDAKPLLSEPAPAGALEPIPDLPSEFPGTTDITEPEVLPRTIRNNADETVSQVTQFNDSEQTRPEPLPPKVEGEEPDADVNIRRRGNKTIEEYSLNGRVYLVKIIPDNGITYFYVDTDGDGRLESKIGEDVMEPVKPANYKLIEWD